MLLGSAKILRYFSLILDGYSLSYIYIDLMGISLFGKPANFFCRESRRKTPNTVAFKDNERHFSDPALSVVSFMF